MDDTKKPPLTDAQADTVVQAANILLVDALTLTNADATLAIGALSLALATAGVLAKVPIDVLEEMFFMQYANQVLIESARLLQDAAEDMEHAVKPPKTDKGLN